MTLLSRRSFLKLSALTAVSAAVAVTASGCTVPVSKPGYTVAATALQTVSSVKIKMSKPLVEVNDGQHYMAAFSVQNNSEDIVKIPLNAFSATYKDKSINGLTASYKDKSINGLTASFRDELTLPVGGSADIYLYLPPADGMTVGNDLKIKFRLKGKNGFSCIEYRFDTDNSAKATTTYTEFDVF